MSLSEADLVWNRMLSNNDVPLRVGDRRLAALNAVTGLVFNGGLPHALAVCEAPQIWAASDAAQYFGLTDLATVFDRLLLISIIQEALEDPDAADDELEMAFEICRPIRELSDAYDSAARDEDVFKEAFRRKLRAAPDDFAPVTRS